LQCYINWDCTDKLQCVHGTCNAKNGDHNCTCDPGFSGFLCEYCLPCMSGPGCNITCNGHGTGCAQHTHAHTHVHRVAIVCAAVFQGRAHRTRACVTTDTADRTATSVLHASVDPTAMCRTLRAAVRGRWYRAVACVFACGVRACVRACVLAGALLSVSIRAGVAGHGACASGIGCECKKGWGGVFCNKETGSSSSGSNAGAVAGGVVGGIVGVAAIAAIVYFRCDLSPCACLASPWCCVPLGRCCACLTPSRSVCPAIMSSLSGLVVYDWCSCQGATEAHVHPIVIGRVCTTHELVGVWECAECAAKEADDGVRRDLARGVVSACR
jgi:hypothetical protein